MTVSPNRILITGAAGMLGGDVFDQFRLLKKEVLATDINDHEPWVEKLDVRDIEACNKVMMDFRPELIIHLAALTDIEYCEKNPGECHATNIAGTENIARLCHDHRARMMHISSASVFDGSRMMYAENDEPMPINEYGRSKLISESIVAQNLQQYFIFRAGWMMGGGPEKDKKFIGNIFRQLDRGVRVISAVTDKKGTLTFTKHLAETMTQLYDTQLFGLYHCASSDTCNRYEMANMFIDTLGLSDKITVSKTNTDAFMSQYPVPRPEYECLSCDALLRLGLMNPKTSKDCIQHYARQFVHRTLKY